MTNFFHKKNQKRASFCLLYLIPILLSIIVATITSLITIRLQSAHERPNLKILGAMPIHLYEDRPFFQNRKYRFHRLGIIFKVENMSPTPTIVHMGLLRGCILLNPFTAENQLPKNQRIPNSTNINFFNEKHAKTIQKIRVSMGITHGSKSVSEYGISYIGAILSFPTQGAVRSVFNSISLDGKCEDIKVANSQPAVHQLLDIGGINKFPKNLCKEFYNGDIELSLFVGNEEISINPSKIIKPLRTLRSKYWEELALPQMYENPDTSYPPTNNGK